MPIVDSQGWRIAIVVALSIVLIGLVLAVEPGMIAMVPALLVAIWLPVVAPNTLTAGGSVSRRLVAASLLGATLLVGVLLFVALRVAT